MEHILNQSTPNFYRISNSIETPLVGRAGVFWHLKECIKKIQYIIWWYVMADNAMVT